MTPLENTIEQKQIEQLDRQLADALPHIIASLCQRAGNLGKEIEVLTLQLAEAREDRARYQRLIDSAIALQEYVSPCLEEVEDLGET